MFSLIVQNRAAFPLEFRTEGEAYLLRHQQDLERNFWQTTTGAARPPWNHRHPPPGSSCRYSRQESPPCASSSRFHSDDDGTLVHVPRTPYPTRSYGPSQSVPIPPLRFGTTTPTPAATSRTQTARPRLPGFSTRRLQTITASPRVPTPTVSADGGPGYLGTVPPNPNDRGPTYDVSGYPTTDSRPNTRWNIGDLLFTYVQRHPENWARGIRSFLFQVARTIGDTPCQDDVLAYQTIVVLAPASPRGATHQYHLFFDMAICLFSIRGLFAFTVRTGGYLAT